MLTAMLKADLNVENFRKEDWSESHCNGPNRR